MKQKLEEVVDMYLQMETNYAVVITGKWGSGKTYYFNNVLKASIEKKSLLENETKKYKAILVSLFGLQSIEQIQLQIILELFPLLKNKKVKIGASITKTLIKGFMAINGVEKYYNLIENFQSKDFLDIIDLDEIVLCFDDLERLSEGFSVNDFIGYINTIVEHTNNKVLIITNEEELKNEKYRLIKEKVIGITIEYELNIESTFDSLIAKKFIAFPVFKDYLLSKKDIIIKNFRKNCSNLRTLSFALSYFQFIFSEVVQNLQSSNILFSKKEEILQNLLNFTIAISIEYKAGRISLNDHKNLKTVSLDSIFGRTVNAENDNKPYPSTFRENYYENERFIFYTSVYNTITGSVYFNFTDLQEQLNETYHVKNQIIQPHYRTFEELKFNWCLLLPDKEYLVLTEQLNAHLKSFAFVLEDYIEVFYFLVRFNNPLKLNIDKLEEEVLVKMNSVEAEHKYNPVLSDVFDHTIYNEFGSNIDRLKKEALLINERVKTKNDQRRLEELQYLFYNNFNAFYEAANERSEPDEDFTELFQKPFFASFNPQEFLNFFINNVEHRIDLVSLIRVRYKSYNPNLLQEVPFLEQLIVLLHHLDAEMKGTNVTGMLVRRLYITAKNALKDVEFSPR